MGLWDTIRNFFGGHGVRVTLTRIEDRPLDAAVLSADDPFLNGTFTVTTTREQVILAHEARLEAVRETDDGAPEVLEIAHERYTGEDACDAPYTIRPGETVEGHFSLQWDDEDGIPAVLDRWGYDDVGAAMDDPKLTFRLTVVADVKAAVVDASARATLPLTEGGISFDDDDDDTPVRLPMGGPPATREAGIRTLTADPGTFFERFEAMVEALRAHPQITVVEYEVSPPATEEEIARAREHHPVADAVLAFYRMANGLKLTWKVDGAPEAHRGTIRILPIEQVYTSWKGTIWYDEAWDDGSTRPLHPFDFFVDEACAALILDGSDAEPKVAYHYLGEEVLPMEVTFGQYLELLLRTRGIQYWQVAIGKDVEGGREYTTSPGQFRRLARRLFDDYDETFLFRRDYAASDAEVDEKRNARIAEVLAALDGAGVTCRFRDSGMSYIDIDVLDQPENLARLGKALATLGEALPDDDDWGALGFGDLMIHKESDLTD